MKLDTKAVGFASASVAGILYILCALLFWFVPDSAIRLFNYFVHGIDLTAIARFNISFKQNIIGLLLTLAFSFLFGALFAVVYNKFAK